MAGWKLDALGQNYQPIAKLCFKMTEDTQKFRSTNLIKIYEFLDEENNDLAMSNLSHSLKEAITLKERQALFSVLLKKLNKYIDTVDIASDSLKIQGRSPLNDLSPLMLINFKSIDISSIGTDDINELIFLAPDQLKINLLTYSKFSHELQDIRHEVIK
ncbi:hypothetical protein PQO01_04680 [Lentisphaera marina]|uniref:hypothetical protein n=1 Tax=Lentisphaera marina TaxID=1111041 RepID=UPI00236736A5|nr:hypothetical protein [Lentisphaera marina]MDD7984240.1 hypothetical protein [Lentisphaera marina]